VMEISEREVSFLWTHISPWQTKDLLYSETTAPTSTPQPPTKHSLTITEFKILVKHSCLFVSRDMHVKCRGVLASLPLHSLLFFFFFANKLSLEKQKSVFFFSWIDLQYSNLMVLISELPILGEF
jgi:hypothetical protein